MNERNIKPILINGRKLKEIVFNKSGFLDWVKRNIEKNNLKENYDYFIEKELIKTLKKANKEKLEYYFTKEASRKILLSQRRSKLTEKMQRRINSQQRHVPNNRGSE